MLYDPKWEVPPETKPQEPSLAGFIEWLERQDPNQEYNFYEPSTCAWAQYSGRCEGFIGHPFGQIVVRDPWTFGAALARARAIAG